MARPWMPLYVADYIGDTGHLTTTQHGAYLLLMMHYWRKDGLPDDDKQLSKITRLPLKIWIDQREILQAFFHDGWRHKRIDAEMNRTNSIIEKRRQAGYKGGISSALARMKTENAQTSSIHNHKVRKKERKTVRSLRRLLTARFANRRRGSRPAPNSWQH